MEIEVAFIWINNQEERKPAGKNSQMNSRKMWLQKRLGIGATFKSKHLKGLRRNVSVRK